MPSNNKWQNSKIQCQMIHIPCVFYLNISEHTIENIRIPYDEIFSILSIEKVFNQIPFDDKAVNKDLKQTHKQCIYNHNLIH